MVERPSLAIRVVRCTPRRLETAIVEAARAAAVVAVVDAPEQVERALRCGADEALTLGDMNRDTFGASVARAALRREGRERSVEAVRQSLYGPDAAMFDLFGEALASSVVQPLRAATAQLQAFRDALSATAGEARAPQSSRAAKTSPDSDPSSLVDDPLALIKDALHSVERLEGVLLEAPVETVDAREVVDKVAALMRPVIERVADFSIDVVDHECWVRFPRRLLVQIITSALHSAVLNVTRKGGDRFVEVSLVPHEGTALVEVCDDGDTTTSSLPRPWLPRAAAAQLHDPTAIAIALAATQLRQAGGELLVDLHPGEGTTLRIFLPRAKRPSIRASAS